MPEYPGRLIASEWEIVRLFPIALMDCAEDRASTRGTASSTASFTSTGPAARDP